MLYCIGKLLWLSYGWSKRWKIVWLKTTNTNQMMDNKNSIKTEKRRVMVIQKHREFFMY